MKKKLTGFLMCFMMLCTTIFAGCSLVETNTAKYYNQAVAIVENKTTKEVATITKRDLVSGYQSYGYTYEQYYGQTREEAINTTLEMLESRKMILMTAENEFGIKKDGTGLTEKEKTYLWQAVVDSLNSTLQSYYDDIVGTETEDESEAITFTGYEKKAILTQDDGEFVIEKKDAADQLLGDFKYKTPRDFNNADDKAKIYADLVDFVLASDDNYKKAFDNFFKDLKSSEYGMKLSTDAPSVFAREIERMYVNEYENYVVSRYSYSNQNLDSISSITAGQIVDRYTSKVRASFAQYVLEGDSAYDTNVQNSLNETYYFKTDDQSTEFFTVANVLFMFDDAQKSEYDKLTAKINADDGGYYDQQYQQELDRLYSQITPVVRKLNESTDEYEEVTDSTLTVNDVYNTMKTQLSSAQNTGDVNVVGDTINDFIYLYNEDTGMFNAESNYVIGIDKDGNAVSSFVESFNEAGIELYNNGKAEIGDISGLVRSEYGIHVLIYTGKCENLFDGIDSSFSLTENAIQKLYTTRVNVLVDKTYFDVMYDEIYADNYSYFEDANMNFLSENYNVTRYTSRYDDLF